MIMFEGIQARFGLSRSMVVTLAAGLLVTAAAQAALWVVTQRFFPHDDPVAVLHYSTDLGVDFIGQGSNILALPQIGLLVLVMNGVLGLAVLRADRRATAVLWGMIPVIHVVLMGAFYFLWRINV